MADRILNPDHMVAASVPMLARSGGGACAVDHDTLVLMSTCIAHVDCAPIGAPRAKLRPCARVVLGHAAASSQPQPAKAEVHEFIPAAAGQMARRRRGERRRSGAQKIEGLGLASSVVLDELRRARRRGSDELHVVVGRDRDWCCSRSRCGRAADDGGHGEAGVHQRHFPRAARRTWEISYINFGFIGQDAFDMTE